MNENRDRDRNLKSIDQQLQRINRSLAETNRTLEKFGEEMVNIVKIFSESLQKVGKNDFGHACVRPDEGRTEPGDLDGGSNP